MADWACPGCQASADECEAEVERLREALTVTVHALCLDPGEHHHDPACGIAPCASCWALGTAEAALRETQHASREEDAR